MGDDYDSFVSPPMADRVTFSICDDDPGVLFSQVIRTQELTHPAESVDLLTPTAGGAVATRAFRKVQFPPRFYISVSRTVHWRTTPVSIQMTTIAKKRALPSYPPSWEVTASVE